MFEQFSVLMSVYHRENPAFLEQALASVFNNSLPPSEVVLVEDGILNDELYCVIEYYVRHYNLIVVKLKSNIGLGGALNEGMKICRYDLIARMDTDDVCCHDRFEKQMSFIMKNKNTVLLGGGIEEYDETLFYPLGQRLVPKNPEEILEYSLRRNPFNHMTVIFRKEFVESLGGYKHHLYMEDYNLWLRIIATKAVVANLPDILVKVRAGEEMIKRRKGLVYVKSEFILMRLKKNLKLDGLFHSFTIFLIRLLTRLLPNNILSKIYHHLRNGSK